MKKKIFILVLLLLIFVAAANAGLCRDLMIEMHDALDRGDLGGFNLANRIWVRHCI